MNACKDCKVGPGKFEGEHALAYLLYEVMLNGGSDMDIGNTSFFLGPFHDALDQAQFATEKGYCNKCIVEGLSDKSYGAELFESEQGFVYLHLLKTQADYEQEVAAVEASEAEGA